MSPEEPGFSGGWTCSLVLVKVDTRLPSQVRSREAPFPQPTKHLPPRAPRKTKVFGREHSYLCKNHLYGSKANNLIDLSKERCLDLKETRGSLRDNGDPWLVVFWKG